MLSRAQVEKIAKHFADNANYTFNNNGLLVQALTRPSAIGIHVPKTAPDFESLEFFGDKILSLAIAERLRDLYPNATPHELTLYFQKYTRNSDPSKRNGGPLYRVAKELQLEKFIIKADDEDLGKYADRGKLTNNNKSKEGHLADHLEAFIGAMYEDCNRNMKTVSAWVQHHWSFMGLNDEERSETSFGTSVVSDTILSTQEQLNRGTLLLQAAFKGDFKKFCDALSKGASIFTIDQKGRNPLHLSAINGHQKIVEHILISFPELDVNMTDDGNFTALYYAAERGKAPVVETLLENQASIHIDLNEKSATSILMHAASFGHVPIVGLLLKYQWHAIYEGEIEQCLQYVKDNHLPAMEPQLRKAQVLKTQNHYMFTAAEKIIQEPAKASSAIIQIKLAINEGANIYAKDVEVRSIFTLLKLMSVEPRFEILAYILKTAKKIRLGEMDLNDISTDVTPNHTNIITPVYNLLVNIIEANPDDDDIAETIEEWLLELDDSITPPYKTAGTPAPNKAVSKAASIHYAHQNQSSSSSSSSKPPSGFPNIYT